MEFDIKKPHTRYGQEYSVCLEQFGKFFDGAGNPYPDDPAEIRARNLYIPEKKFAAMKVNWDARQAAQDAVETVESVPENGPKMTKTLTELLSDTQIRMGRKPKVTKSKSIIMKTKVK